MAITEAMLARGRALGIAPRDHETSKQFYRRVRREESKASEPAPQPAPADLPSGRGR